MTTQHSAGDPVVPGAAMVSGLGSPVTRRAFFTVAGGIAAAGTLAACGSNTGRSSGATSTAASGPATGASGSKTVLSQWYHQYGETGTQQAVERYAKAYTAATVNVQWTPGNYDQKVAAALLTASGPDIFENGNGPSIDMIQAGEVVPLDGLLGDAASDFNQAMIDRMTYGGHLWAIPQVVDMQLLVYRKSMLDKAGIKPPETYDDLASAAKELTSKSVKGLFVGNDGGVGVLVGPVLWSVGADYLTTDNKVGFTSPEVATAMGRLHGLFTSGSLLLGAPADWSDPSSLTQGLCAMQWTGLWTLPQLQTALGDDFGVAPWPKYTAAGAGAPSVPIGAYGSCVSAKSKNPGAAKDFVKWLWVGNTADQLDFAQSYGFHIPSRTSLAAKADKLKSGEAATAVQILQQYGHAQTPMLWTPAAGTAMSDAVTRIIKDGADPAQQLDSVVKKTESELARVQK